MCIRLIRTFNIYTVHAFEFCVDFVFFCIKLSLDVGCYLTHAAYMSPGLVSGVGSLCLGVRVPVEQKQSRAVKRLNTEASIAVKKCKSDPKSEISKLSIIIIEAVN